MLVKTRYHWLRFYTQIIFLTVFFLGMDTVIIKAFIDLLQSGTLSTGMFVLPALAFSLLAILIYFWNRILKTAKIVKVDMATISIGKDVYNLNDIESIWIDGKIKFPFFFRYLVYGTSIKFKNGPKRLIYDDFYTNAWQVKDFLHQTFELKQQYIPPKYSLPDKEVFAGEISTFRNSQLTSLRGILLWSVTAMFLYVIIFSKKSVDTAGYFFYVYLIFWFALHAWLMFYFQIGDAHLVVRNHVYLWKKQIFLIEDIRHITIEKPGGNSPNRLRIVMKDYRSYSYYAGTLYDDTWNKLRDALEARKVLVYGRV